MKNLRLLLAALVLAVSGFGAANASPIDVSYATTGSSGDWVLDFSVTNNLGGTNAIYFFGVSLNARDIVGSPGSFDPNSWTSWSNNYYGGSSTVYNNNWIAGNINSGTTLSGFEVHVTDLISPSSVQWFAYAYGGTYLGGGNFNSTSNPGFEGVATEGAPSNVPEPGSIVLLSIGMLGAATALRHKRA